MVKVRDEHFESEPLYPLSKGDGAEASFSKLRGKLERLSYYRNILIAAYVVLVIMYIVLAVGYLRLSRQCSELDLFPCVTFSIEIACVLANSHNYKLLLGARQFERTIEFSPSQLRTVRLPVTQVQSLIRHGTIYWKVCSSTKGLLNVPKFLFQVSPSEFLKKILIIIM